MKNCRITILLIVLTIGGKGLERNTKKAKHYYSKVCNHGRGCRSKVQFGSIEIERNVGNHDRAVMMHWMIWGLVRILRMAFECICFFEVAMTEVWVGVQRHDKLISYNYISHYTTLPTN